MSSNDTCKIFVGDAPDYDDFIAEIMFPDKFGLIISQESKPGEYKISVYSFSDRAIEDFDSLHKDPNYWVDLDEFINAIKEARRELDSCLKIV